MRQLGKNLTIFSILLYLYSIKASTLSVVTEGCLILLCRVDRVTNKEVLQTLAKEAELITAIKIRKLQYLGHIIRGVRYQLL